MTVEPGAGPANTEPKIPSEIVFEQSPEQLLNALLPLYLQNQLLRSLILNYNKARQAAITQEILEVVGGSAAAG